MLILATSLHDTSELLVIASTQRNAQKLIQLKNKYIQLAKFKNPRGENFEYPTVLDIRRRVSIQSNKGCTWCVLKF